MNRLQYVDILKAAAITLVVMGHIAEKGVGNNASSFNFFYSSFHMPLFMFLSGLFAYKHIGRFSLDDLWQFAKKKALRIMLPYLVMGGGTQFYIKELRICLKREYSMDTGSCPLCSRICCSALRLLRYPVM